MIGLSNCQISDYLIRNCLMSDCNWAVLFMTTWFPGSLFSASLVVGTETLVAADHVTIYPSKTAGWVGTQIHLIEKNSFAPSFQQIFLPPRFWVVTWPGATRVTVPTTKRGRENRTWERGCYLWNQLFVFTWRHASLKCKIAESLSFQLSLVIEHPKYISFQGFQFDSNLRFYSRVFWNSVFSRHRTSNGRQNVSRMFEKNHSFSDFSNLNC